MPARQDEDDGGQLPAAPAPPPDLDFRVVCRFEYCRYPSGECPHPE